MAGSARIGCVSLASLMALSACVSELPAISQDGIPQSGVAVGRVLAVLTGERSRKYEPAVRLFEVENRQTALRLT